MANVKSIENYYELHESDYPRLASHFFRQLRQEIPQAFWRSVKNSNKHSCTIQLQQHSASSANINGRLKQNCDNFHALRDKKHHVLSHLYQLQTYILQTVHSLDVNSVCQTTFDDHNTSETVCTADETDAAAADAAKTINGVTVTAADSDPSAAVCNSGDVDIISEVLSKINVDENFSNEQKCIKKGSEADYNVGILQGMEPDYDAAIQEEGITSVDSDKSAELLLRHSGGTPHESIERLHTLQSRNNEDLIDDGLLKCSDSVCKFDCNEPLTHMTSSKPPSVRRQHTSDTRSVYNTQLATPPSVRREQSIVVGQDDICFVAPNNKSKFKFSWKKQKKFYNPADETKQWHINFNNWKLRSADNHTLQRVFTIVNGAQSDADTDATDTLSDDILDCSLNDCIDMFSSSVTTTTAPSKPDVSQGDDVSSSPVISMSHQSLHQHVSNIKMNTAKHWQRLRNAVSLQRLNHTADSLHQHVGHTQDSTTYNQSWNKLSERVSTRSCSADRDFSQLETSTKSFDVAADDVNSLSSWRSSTSIDSPRHFRPIGRVVSYNKDDSTKVVELTKPPHGPFGFYLDKCMHNNGAVVVSRLCDALPEHFFAGLLNVGDEVLQLNSCPVSELSADAICDIMAQSTLLLLTIRH